MLSICLEATIANKGINVAPRQLDEMMYYRASECQLSIRESHTLALHWYLELGWPDERICDHVPNKDWYFLAWLLYVFFGVGSHYYRPYGIARQNGLCTTKDHSNVVCDFMKCSAVCVDRLQEIPSLLMHNAAFITFWWFAVYLLEYCYSEILAYRISYTNLIYNFVVNRLTKSIVFKMFFPFFLDIFGSEQCIYSFSCSSINAVLFSYVYCVFCCIDTRVFRTWRLTVIVSWLSLDIWKGLMVRKILSSDLSLRCRGLCKYLAWAQTSRLS